MCIRDRCRSGSMSASDLDTAPAVPAPSFDQDVDASGLTCPLPILRAKKALALSLIHI